MESENTEFPESGSLNPNRELVDIGLGDREEAIELVNQFFRKVNSLELDGLFRIRPRAATKFVDIYLKLAQTDKVFFRGIRTSSQQPSSFSQNSPSNQPSSSPQTSPMHQSSSSPQKSPTSELVSLLIARVEEKPFLEEEKTLFIDIAVTKNGKKRNGYMSLLLESVEEWAKEAGIRSLELRAIRANEEAMEYWGQKGFDPFYVRFRKSLKSEE